LSFGSKSRLARIGEGAFRGCQLRRTRIPRDVEVIGPRCFAQCSQLQWLLFGSPSRCRQLGAMVSEATQVADIMIRPISPGNLACEPQACPVRILTQRK
jgi:hypothetical protein